MIKNLRKKFILTAMCSVILVLTIIIGLINAVNYRKINSDANDILEMLLEGDGRFSGTFLPNGSPSSPKDELFSPETPFETRFFTVSLGKDGVAFETNTAQIAAIGDKEASSYAERLYERGISRGYVGNYKFAAKSNGEKTLYVFLDMGRSLSTYRNFLLMSILIALIGSLGFFVLVYVFSKMVFRPVEESYAKQKSFITNASHDIKTPLTIIAADTEVIEMESGESTWTSEIKTQVARLSDLTEKLVFLSRMEEENVKMHILDFSISDLVAETAQEFSARATGAGKPLKLDIATGLEYRGDEGMIRRLISLLIDNAIKYGTENSEIYLRLTERNRRLELTLENAAEGLDLGSHDELFDRFTRSDKSRNSAGGGHGIGLSAARAIVQAHKGRISATSPVPDVMLITVILPR